MKYHFNVVNVTMLHHVLDTFTHITKWYAINLGILSADKMIMLHQKVNILTDIKHRMICEICGPINCQSVKEMNAHSKTHSYKNTSFVCKYCPSNNPTSFPRKIQLRIHERKVHEKHLINRTASKIESEIGSSLEVTKEKEHQICEICNYECISKSALEKHILTHTKERPHECPECHKRFVQTSHVNYHIKTVHAPPGTLRLKQHSCFECGASNLFVPWHFQKHYATQCSRLFSHIDTYNSW